MPNVNNSLIISAIRILAYGVHNMAKNMKVAVSELINIPSLVAVPKWGPTTVNRKSIDVLHGDRKVGVIRLGNRGEFAQAEVISGARMPESIVSLYGKQAIDLIHGEVMNLTMLSTMVRGYELDVEGTEKQKALQYAEEVCEKRDLMQIPDAMLKEVDELDQALGVACSPDDSLPETTKGINDAARRFGRLLDRIQRNKTALAKATEKQGELIAEALATIDALQQGGKTEKKVAKDLQRNFSWWSKLFTEYTDKFDVSKVLNLQSKEENALLLAKSLIEE